MVLMAGPAGTGARADPELDHPALTRLGGQLAWYSRKSSAAQRAFTRLKVVELVIAAAVPVVAAASGPPLLTAALAAVVVVLEGMQQRSRPVGWCSSSACCSAVLLTMPSAGRA